MSPAATHILVFPFPAQGHMLPLLDLSHELASRGLEITVLVTRGNLPILEPLLLTHPNSIRTLVLSFPPHPALPAGAENVKDIGSWSNGPIIESLAKLEGEVIEWFESQSSPPRALISDFFLGYTNRWAKKLSIPRIAFFSSGAFITSVANHILLDKETVCSLDTVEFKDFPKSPSFVNEHVPEIVRILKNELLENCRSWGIVSNTFHALEGEYLDHIKNKQIHARVYAVGPLSLTSERSKSNLDLDIDQRVLSWLDKCPDESVLYVCFGSQKLLSRPQMEALGLGLKQSKARFVWVINSTTSQQVDEEPTWVPDDDVFEGNGLVIKGWVPQVEILNHKAVGGFLSHCGWNSLLESVAAGVMVLAWPMEGDQFVNARLLVKERGLGVQVCEGENAVPDPDTLARTISESLAGKKPQKDKAKLMREKAIEAVAPGGSSFKDLDNLVKELRQIDA